MSNTGQPPEKPPMPPQPKTTELPAITDRALLEDLGRVVRNMAENLGMVVANVNVLMEDRPILHSRLAGVEGRMARLESPTNPPPPPITSERVRAIVDQPSKPDLEQQAKLAALVVEQDELKTAIRETHTLASNAATKYDMQKLADGTATKAEVKAIADAQTSDIVKSLEGLAARNKTVRNLLIAFAALAFLAMNAATTYLMRLQPAPAPQPQQMQAPK